jgi:hypothetical protein
MIVRTSVVIVGVGIIASAVAAPAASRAVESVSRHNVLCVCLFRLKDYFQEKVC